MIEKYLTSLIFLTAGSAILIVWIYFKQKRDKLLRTGTVVEGIVFDFVSRSLSDSAGDYPVIRFVTIQQEWITQTYKISYPKIVLKRGQKVEVYYNPEKPSDFILKLKIDNWLLGLLVIIALACFVWAAISFINVL